MAEEAHLGEDLAELLAVQVERVRLGCELALLGVGGLDGASSDPVV
jgi:hypothetical protein